MTRLYISASVAGSQFYPSKLPEKWNVHLLDRIDAGAIATTGRYRGNPSPQGHALIGVPEGKDLPELIALLEKMKVDLAVCGADEISVFVTLDSDDQANWAISPDNLIRLGKLNASLLFECVQS